MSMIQIDKSLLQPSAVHINQPLTNISVAYAQTAGFVADRVFPVVPVEKQTDLYYIFDRDQYNRIGHVQERAPRTRAPVIGMKFSTDSYTAKVYSLGADIDIQTASNADAALQLKQTQTEILTQNLLIDREVKWANTFFKAGVWGTEYTGVSAAPSGNQFRQWSDYVNSTPINDITTAMRVMQLKSGGYKPNTLIVGKEVRDILVNHPTILARLNGGSTVSNPALITDAKIAEILGVQRFLVMEAVYNTSPEGIAESNSFIGGKFALLLYVPPAAGMRTPSAGYTFAWDGLQGGSGYGFNVKTYSGDWLQAEGIAELMEVNMAYAHKVTGADLGFFMNTIVA